MSVTDGLFKVLVVDDNEDGVLMLSIILQHMGHQVRVAFDGEAALEVGEEFSPDLVLLDINLPKMDGFSTCRMMRNSDWARKAHIAALTGRGQKEDRRHALKVGFDEYLLKPVGRDTLQQVIAKCLTHK